MPDNQREIIVKLNRFLRLTHPADSKDKAIQLSEGQMCHGFSLVWLYSMAEGTEDGFYYTVQKLLAIKDDRYARLAKNLNLIISYIRWSQDPENFVNEVGQLQIDKILELPQDFIFSLICDDQTFDKAFDAAIEEKKLFCICGDEHTIGFYQRGEKYFILDPDKSYLPFVTTDRETAKKQIILGFINRDKIPPTRLSLTIHRLVFSAEEKRSPRINFSEQFISSETAKHISALGYTNLHLACENGLEKQAALLIENNCDINHASRSGYTGLILACWNNHYEIASLLLSHGANLHMQNCIGSTALHAAAKKGNDKIVALLLTNGANPLIFDKANISSLQHALARNHWNSAAIMLSYIETPLSERVVELLQKNSREMISAFKSLMQTIPQSHQRNVRQIVRCHLRVSKEKKVERQSSNPFAFNFKKLRSYNNEVNKASESKKLTP